MNPKVTKEFIKVTHEVYKSELGEYFGKTVKGIFTDEPQLLGDYPWSSEIEKAYRAEYGEDIRNSLWKLKMCDGGYEFKYRYRMLTNKLFSESYVKPINKWCEQNGLAFTGHFGCEDGLVDAGLRHLRIGDDVAAGAQRLDPLRDRVVGEDEIVGIVKVGSRVDGALDDELVFRVELTVSQQLGDDLEAAALNVHRSDLFQHGVSPFGTRPESGRQRMDSRKNGNADSPRRGCPWRRRTASCGRRASPP